MQFDKNGVTAKTVSAELEALEAQEAARNTRRKGRLQALVALICAGGVLVGMQVTRSSRKEAAGKISEEMLTGTWELQSINNEPITHPQSVLLSQRVTFQEGTVQGETVLKANTEAGTTAMPFPDESASLVKVSPDGQQVRVLWGGTYKIAEKNKIELKIGQAIWRVSGKWNPEIGILEFDHDTVLTYPGATRYRISAKPGTSVTVKAATAQP